MDSTTALIIFTRNPELGKCKTRLAKSVGNVKALKIYEYLLGHTANICARVSTDRYVYYSEEIVQNDIWEGQHFRKRLQHGDDLGEKMENAFSILFKNGYEKVIIVGSDLLDLQEGVILKAFEKLNNNDLVLGPANDGGYYLLGMKELIPPIFRNKKWGTDTVLRETLANLLPYKVHLLKELNDIDTFEDLKSSPYYSTSVTLRTIIQTAV